MWIERAAGRNGETARALTQVTEKIGSATALRDHLAAAIVRNPEGYQRIFSFGPHCLSLQIHGATTKPAIARALMPAGDRDEPSFSVHVLDAEICDSPRASLNWTPADFGLKRTVPGWSTDDLKVLYLRTHDGIAVIDWNCDRAIIWVPSLSAFPSYELAAPLRWLFDLVAARLGLMMLHAACVGVPDCGLLIAGASGSGKSTLALSAAAEGLDYISDDYCLVAPCSQIWAHALYPTGKLCQNSKVPPASADRLGPASPVSPKGKSIVFLDSHNGANLARCLPVKAIILPEFGVGPDASVVSAPSHFAFRRLAPSTLAQSESDVGPLAAKIAQITRAVPAYRLVMPREPRRAVTALSGLAQRITDETRRTP